MRPDTALKLEEVRFFLDQLGHHEGKHEFRFYLNAFLNAVDGFFHVVHAEYHGVSGFEAWEAASITPRIRRGGNLFRFIEARNKLQHREALKLRTEMEDVGFIPTQHPNPRRPRFRARPSTPGRSQVLFPFEPVQQQRARWYLAGDRTDAWSRCDWCHGELQAIAEDCTNQFG